MQPSSQLPITVTLPQEGALQRQSICLESMWDFSDDKDCRPKLPPRHKRFPRWQYECVLHREGDGDFSSRSYVDGRKNLLFTFLICLGTMDADPVVKRFRRGVVISFLVAVALALTLGILGVSYVTGWSSRGTIST